MFVMIPLGVRELLNRRRTTVGLVLGVAIVLLVFLALGAITAGIGQSLTLPETDTMRVLPKGASGFWGSYLPLRVRKQLKGLGARLAVPQIYVIRERAPGDLLIFRGVPLADYRSVIGFRMVAGEPLAPGDRGMVLVGRDVAESRGLEPGDPFTYQGKSFAVKGVFETGLVTDSEVWLDFDEAARLFNAIGFASTFAIEADPALARKVEERLDLDVVTEKQVWESFRGAAESLFVLLRLVSVIVALAAVLGVMNMVFTLVRQRRREIAVLRAVGFGRKSVLAYVLAQSLAVAIAVYGLAIMGALTFLRGVRMQAMGMTLEAVVNLELLASALGLTLLIGLLAGAYPAWRAAHWNVAETLRGE